VPISHAVNRLLVMCAVFAASALSQTGVERQLASAARQRETVSSMNGSLALQQASIRTQVRLAPARTQSFFVTMDSNPAERAEAAGCDPLPAFEARGLVERAARKAGIDANLLHAVATQESAFRPCAVSNKGAQGLMQLMPATAAELGVQNPFDASESLDGGAALLKQLLARYSGDLNRVLGAYNAGPARVDAAGGVPAIPETMNYVERILGKLP